MYIHRACCAGSDPVLILIENVRVACMHNIILDELKGSVPPYGHKTVQIICISVLFFGNVVTNFNTSRQYSRLLLFFLNIVTYFVLSKEILILYDQLFLEFPYEGKSLSASLQHRRPNSYLHKEILRREKIEFWS